MPDIIFSYKLRNVIKTTNARMLSDINVLGTHANKKFAMQTIKHLLVIQNQEVLFFKYFREDRTWKMQLASKNKTEYRLRTTITSKDILNICPSFIQVSPSCILNIDYLESVENKTLRCILRSPFEHIEIYATQANVEKMRKGMLVI